MSTQSNKVLFDLVKCQRFEGNAIFVDYDSETFVSVCEHGEEPIIIKFRYSKPELLSIFNHLVKEEYIVDGSNGNRSLLVVTHKGNHQTQARVSKFLKFVSASIIIPIIVALLTSVSYHILSYWFPWIRPA